MNGPVTVAGIEVAPGERRDLSPIASEGYTGDRTTIPMAVVNGVEDGPRVFVTAAVHGDELNGTAVCQRLLTLLDPAGLRGVVTIVPIVNVLGAQIHSRYLPDRRDLNRSFPGTLTGSMASRMARLIHDEVVAPADVGIDLHTAANRRTNVPQVRIDVTDARAVELARVFGAPYSLAASLRPGSLREAARSLGVPVLTYEAGEPLRFDEGAIAIGLDGVLRVLVHLGMLASGPAPTETVMMFESKWLRADRGGVLDVHVRPGDGVAAGTPLWTTSSPLGEERATAESPVDGVVIGGTTLPVVSPGDAILHIGLHGEREPLEDDPSAEEDSPSAEEDDLLSDT